MNASELPEIGSTFLVKKYFYKETYECPLPSNKYGTPSLVYGTPSLVYGTPSLVYGTPSLVYGTPSLVYGTPSLGSTAFDIEL